MRRWIAILLCLLACVQPWTAAAQEEAPYTGVIGKRMDVYARASDKSTVLGKIEAGTTVDVYEQKRTYTRIDYQGQQGYVLTKYTERVQRKNPFDGPMPGTSVMAGMGVLTRDASFKPEGYRYAITMTKGTWLAVENIQNGKAYFPYRKEEELQCVPLDALEMTDIVGWDSAQPGELLSAFSTFYSVSRNSQENINRMYNIALACERLQGMTIPAQGRFSFNEVCGPYEKENGYEEAPILSGTSDVGYGGGVCQVATTLYNNILRVPSFIVDRHWHGQGGTKYIPAGFDATVGSRWDLVFDNVLPYGIRVFIIAQDGVITAAFYRASE